jgi:hypothetical protein
LTAGQAVRVKCMERLGIEKGQKAYDGGCAHCILYAAHPFRGQLLPLGQRPSMGYDEAVENAHLATIHARVPKRQPSASLCAKHCWDCNGDSREDCGAMECALFPFRPMQPGGRPRKKLEGEALETARERVRRLHPEAVSQPEFGGKAGVAASDAGIPATGQVSLAL